MSWLRRRMTPEDEHELAKDEASARAAVEQSSDTLRKTVRQERETLDTVQKLTRIGEQNNFVEALRIVLGGAAR